ncbi:hypothetical protein C0Q70_02340 [Pomacea canaliculata]|uniref:Reelin domain-containing protein n=1 Tax=Pomacea canaliculata TaxID=400727 RepID=A0A2T7PPN4_POMCA|nr:hypothetical protein C0Q70_02340 [Pomacea canaliculata]
MSRVEARDIHGGAQQEIRQVHKRQARHAPLNARRILHVLGAPRMPTQAPCLLVLIFLVTEVRGYSTGAPSDGCWSERPFHDDNLPSHTCAPYVIDLEKDDPQDAYTARDIIKVRIRSVDGTPFRGYLLKVTGSSGVAHGRWAAHKTNQKHLSTCGVTHANATDQTEVTVLWQAPKDPSMGAIQFKSVLFSLWSSPPCTSISLSVFDVVRYSRCHFRDEGDDDDEEEEKEKEEEDELEERHVLNVLSRALKPHYSVGKCNPQETTHYFHPPAIITHSYHHPQLSSPTAIITPSYHHPQLSSPTGIITHSYHCPQLSSPIPRWWPLGVVTAVFCDVMASLFLLSATKSKTSSTACWPSRGLTGMAPLYHPYLYLSLPVRPPNRPKVPCDLFLKRPLAIVTTPLTVHSL